MAKSKKKKPGVSMFGKLLMLSLILTVLFILAGFVDLGSRTALGHFDKFAGTGFQSTHNHLFSLFGDLDSENPVIIQKRKSGKKIQRLEDLEGPMGDISEEDNRALERILETN